MGARRSAKTERSPSRAGRKESAPTRLRRAEQRLRQLEKRHAIAMGAINESVYDWDIAAGSTYFSSGMERVLGLPPNALKSLRDWYERIHPDDFPRYRDATIAHLKGNSERFECDYRYRAQDGSWHWARTHGLAIRNKQGRAIRMIGSTGDITELKASEERYALATSVAVEGIYEWNVQTGELFLSSRAKDFFALPAGELSPAAWNRRIHGDDFAAYRAAIMDHFKSRTSQLEHEYRISDGRGGYRWVLDRGIGVRDASGRVVKVVGALSDITPRKEAELELRRAHDQAEQALAQQTATAEILRATLGSPTDLQRVFQAILTNASQLCEASFAGLFLFQDGLLYNVAQRNASADFALALQRMRARPSRETTTRRCALERRTIHTPDLLNDPDFTPPQPQRRENVRTALSVPMLREGALFGVITLWRGEVRPFSDHQIALVQTFADQAVIAIENVRLFHETREALERQTATAEILGVISSSPTDTQPVFDAIVKSGLKLFPGAAVAVALPDGDQVRFAAIADRDREREEAWKSRFPFPLTREYMHGVAILDARLVDVPDARDAPPGLEVGCANFLASGYRAATMMPMIRGRGAIGAVSVLRLEPGPLTDRQLAVLRTFADQAVIAIENARLFRELQARNRELTESLEQQTATAETLKVIASSPADVQPVFDAIVRNAVRLGHAAVGFLISYDGTTMDLVAQHNIEPRLAPIFRSAFPRPATRDTMTGRSICEREVINIPDISASDFAEGPKDRARRAGSRSALVVPLLRGGEPIGALNIQRREAGGFSETFIALLKTFADQAVIAIENVRLFNETKEALERQTATADILRVISRSPTDLQPVMDSLVANAARLCGAEDALIFRLEGGVLRHVARFGTLPAGRETIPVNRHSVTGRVVVDRDTIHLHDIGPGYEAEFPESVLRTLGIRSILATPLLRHGVPIGAILVRRGDPHPFPDKHVALLKTFADQAVIAIENVRLFNETREALEREKASGEVLQAISSSIADTRPVFDKILESCERLFAGKTVGVNLVGEDRLIRLGAYHGPGREGLEQVFPIPLNRDSGSGRAIVDRRVISFADVENDPGVPSPTRRGTTAIGCRSVIFAPMLWKDEGLGAIFVAREQRGHFQEKDVALLRTFADQAVIAIQNARLFRETEVANRHKSEFLASMSHELRTPLNAIIGFTRIVMRRSRERLESKQYENLEKILASSQHLLTLINAILDLSKIEAGRLDMHVAEFELAPVLEQCLRTVEPLVKAGAVKLVRDFDDTLPALVADAEKLRQIVINLLSNAAKFTPQGNIRLQARAVDGVVRVAVADTGIGIAADKLGLIFEEFRQADDGSTREYGGTGLGLAIARRLARLMGGDIDVVSQPGSGSTFTLTLPPGHSA